MQWIKKLISGLLCFLNAVRLPLFAALAVVISEWLFIVTKPSFLSDHSTVEKLFTLFQVGILVCGALSLVLASTWLLLCSINNQKGRKILSFLANLIGALLLTILTVLMLDNFTYTLLGFGIRSIHSNLISIGANVLIIVVFIKIFGWCKKHQASETTLPRINPLIGVSVLLVLCVGLALRFLSPTIGHVPMDEVEVGSPRVNIIIISMDAVEADHMSVYGYHKDTTPFLNAHGTDFLISENSFTNHSPSFGSVGTLLTGKYSTTTRLIYPPEKLTGKDQFDHLPGILRSAGYRSLDMSLRWYADPVDMNMRCGFDFANFRTVSDCDTKTKPAAILLAQFDLPLILIDQIKERVMERLEILKPWGELAPNPNGLLRVGQPAFYWHKDHSRIQAALEFIELANNQPFFINLHLMGTHGPTYLLDERYFSLGQSQINDWQDDFYDDAIRQADGQVGVIYRKLKSLGILDTSVIVISSDHGRDQSFESRLPLMIRFPRAQHSKVISGNTQRLDIAPTLLDFIDLEIPDWMEGDSLIADDYLDLMRKSIIQTRPSKVFEEIENGSKSVTDVSAPFFSLGGISIIECDHLFSWDLEENTFQISFINDHTKPCGNNGVFSSTDLMTKARNHLLERGYDVQKMRQPREASKVSRINE